MTIPSEIRIEDFNYSLPESQIAKYPLSPRDSSKLLVFKNKEIRSEAFSSLASEVPENAHLVFNNTKVIPARLFFRKQTGALIEIFLLEPILPSKVISQVMESTESTTWMCMIGNKKKWKDEVLSLDIPFENGTTINVKAELVNREENTISFKWTDKISFAELVKVFGEIPLPPYLNRKTEEKDKETYQTVYSESDGAVAAPTAGLHFTDSTFKSLKKRGIKTSFITLHVGAGTFQPVKTENALEHHMHSEQIVFSKDFLKSLLKHDGPVIPVGTTSMRSLESLYWFALKIRGNKEAHIPFKIEKLYPYGFEENDLPSKKEAIEVILEYMENQNFETLIGDTEIYIFPGYKPRLCEGIITNFHQPKSTLLLLISSLIGDKWKELYDFALENDYRFLSYGDSSLILP
ncbi:S-adenosylmethionine:tRNA ribosyltransferase-isomerase [Arcticibacterium luteifluviistationis]|uniref:S-adenosylmethionine:tRNA ribosyltransferase-isomerase n=1 Tax=Arcticibacterium luteifluviistationis TaxID=1784714 RepID=A0A2Z4GGK1_9BACT|nr:S-adenosylmethionine:tRNA ribosyltransferase-isomerase [Arcticibacterium luteifluviistationis]AWV99923.1 S-adenosylmethionine tRNA ribosyltransferase [Arcticibacterium luteifluviistationis]